MIRPGESIEAQPLAVSALRRSTAPRSEEPTVEIDGLGKSAEAAGPRGFCSQPPAPRAAKSVVLDQAYDEYCLVLEAGETPDPDAFCERFPDVKTSLRRLIAAHRYFEENSHLLADGQPVKWPEPGEPFLGFALLRELGRGAFARVFLAAEPALGNRLVAVKVSLQGAAEAKTLGRICHPNIVPVHSVQEDPVSGLMAVCMPYLGSATLCDVQDHAFARPGTPDRAMVILEAIRDTARPSEPPAGPSAPARLLQTGTYVDGICYIAAQLAEALAFIHAAGIYHRDLKPSNVLMSPDGTPMLLDFNLSFDGRLADNRLGGTLPYMPPEQLLAADLNCWTAAALVNARSDLFSLGVILYELLAGAHPFGPISLSFDSVQVREHLIARQRSGPRPLRRANTQVDPPLARLIERCLAFDPHDRPGSAAELAGALRHSLSRRRRARRWTARHRRVVLAAASCVLAASLVAGYSWSMRKPSSQRQLSHGLAAYQGGELDRAIEDFTGAIKEGTPDRAWALFARGRAHQQQGDITLALADYQSADQQISDPRIKACIGYCLSKLHDHEEATGMDSRAIAMGFAPAEVLNNLGYSSLQRGRLDQAEKSLNQAIQQNPRLQAAFYNRAMVDAHRFFGPVKPPAAIPQRGIDDIRKALQLGPATAKLYYDAATLCALAAQHDASWTGPALEYVKKAIDHGLDPRRVSRDPLFRRLPLPSQFQASSNGPVRTTSSGEVPRLVDPVRDIPELAGASPVVARSGANPW